VILAVALVLILRPKSPSTNISLSGSDAGQGVALYIPPDIKLVSDSSKNIKVYSQTSPTNSKANRTTVVVTSSPLAYVGASSEKKFRYMLGHKSSSDYKKFSAMVANFILNNAATGPSALNLAGAGNNSLSLDQPVAFANYNVSSAAWEFDFKLSRPNLNQKATVDGKFIYIIGDTAYYRLLVSSVDDSWQANQKTWDKIIGSLQINR
jgi:hypothetical protein